MRAGMGCAFAELIPRAASAGHVEFQRRTDEGLLLGVILCILAFGMRLPAMPTGDEGGRIVEGEFPPRDVRAQVDLADLEGEASP